MITQEELRCANYRNLISPMIFLDELWAPIKLFNISDGYWVSTYGRIYSEKLNCLLQGHIVNNGYVIVTLRTKDNSRIYAHIHRLVMLTFRPIDHPENYVVNHIDGIKTHNFLLNLEWTTQKDNVRHAFSIGLRGVGEQSSHTVFTDEQVHHVCKCMENGYDIYAISQEVFGTPPTQQIKSLCTNISTYKFWTHVSCQYAIENYKKNKVFSNIQLQIIINLLTENPNICTKDILDILEIYEYSKKDYERLNRAIWNIKRKYIN